MGPIRERPLEPIVATVRLIRSGKKFHEAKLTLARPGIRRRAVHGPDG